MRRIVIWTGILLTMAMAVCAGTAAMAESALEPLPMDEIVIAPAPKDENYLSEFEYLDNSIAVKIHEGRYADTDYVYAHVKIAHPSQLRTAPATMVYTRIDRVNFYASSTGKGRDIAKAANAVVAMNGDFYTMKKACHIVLRHGKQYRNISDGIRDVLVIDKNGDFSYLNKPTHVDYNAYYEAHKEELYQVFSFGPALVENGVSIIPEDYENGYIGATKNTQRAAIAQAGPLEYVMITSYGNQTKGNKGMTIYEFAALCEQIGKEVSPDGFRLAFNLDGGNSSTLVFKRKNEWDILTYAKVNCPEIERSLSDIIYFTTLVK